MNSYVEESFIKMLPKRRLHRRFLDGQLVNLSLRTCPNVHDFWIDDGDACHGHDYDFCCDELEVNVTLNKYTIDKTIIMQKSYLHVLMGISRDSMQTALYCLPKK